MPAGRESRPSTLLVAAALLCIEALTALVFGFLEAGQVRASRAVVGVGVAILMVGYGVLLLLVVRGVLRGRRWSRGPAVVTQLILLPIAWSFRGVPTTWVAGLLAAVAIATLVALLHPRSTAMFIREPDAPSRHDDGGLG